MKVAYGTPVLTICQPWAWAIAVAGKDVENRSWATRYRGPLIIHAGKSHSHLGSLNPADYPGCPAVPALLDFGAVVAVARLADVVLDSKSAWAERRMYHWALRDVVKLATPVACQGAQGLWWPHHSTIDAINEQIRGAR